MSFKSPRFLAVLLALFLVAGTALATATLATEHESENESDDEVEGEDARDEDDDEEDEARDRDEDDDDEDEDESLKREVSVEVDDEGIEIELKRETGDDEDKFEVAFDYDDAAFEAEHETETADNETENKLEVQFDTLAEYVDGNGNGKYDAGEEIVSSWALSGDGDDADDASAGAVQWTGAVVDDIELDGKTGKRITATATFGDNGTFELRMIVFGDFVDIENSTLEPTSVKFDIAIDGFPYTANDTALALFMETEAKREVDHDDDEAEDDEEGVAAGTDDNLLVFTWKGNATVDGADTSVGTTELALKEEQERGETKQERSIVLSYARGDSILHDPEFAMLSSAEETEQAPGLAPFIVAVGALALVGVARRRDA